MAEFYSKSKAFIEGQLDGQKYAQKYIKNIATYLNNLNNVNAKINGLSAKVGYSIMQQQAENNTRNNVQFRDLKPYFRKSPKAKHTKDGGWYLVVPIQKKTTQLRSAYSRSVWDEISHMGYGQTASNMGNLNRVQKTLGTSQWGVNKGLKYQWKSTNITRVPWGASGKRAHYVQFRTVSNKSAPNSWIVGRRNFTTRIVPNMYAEQISQIIKQHVNVE